MWRMWLALGLPCLAMAGEYRVGVGDRLHITVYEEDDLSGDVVVSEACAVSLALIGRVEVCNRTPAEIEQLVSARYEGDYLVNPTVAVQVMEYRSQRVDVIGEVARRGPVYLEGPTTLVEVISLAGGPTAENVVHVEIVSADGTTRRYDLNTLTAGSDGVLARPGDKIVLKPGEVVYVEGQVRRAGTVTLTERLTVTQALAVAGGADEFANLRRVVVRRADGSQVKVNVPRVHKGVEEDVVLAPDDHLIVPRGAF